MLFRSRVYVGPNQYAPFPVIRLHVDLTACPGARLYARLPALRRSVARLEGAFSQLAITGPPAPVPFGTGYTATGRLTVPGGADAAGAQIELRQLTGGAERVLGATTAAPDGSWSAQLPAATGTAPIRAVFAGDGSRPGVVSNTGYVVVAPQVALAATPTTVAARGSVVASGTVRPAKARVRVTAYLVRPDGGLRKVASRTVGARSARYRAKLRLKGAGTYRLVTRAGPDAASTGGRSAPFEVQVSP